jgi:hypothetical protein
MVDPIQAMLAAGVVPTDSLPATSRYRDVGTAAYGAEPDAIAYFRRRLVPLPERFQLLSYVQVREGDRRDLLAHQQLGDAALWWRLADAQGVLDPADLEQPPGRWVRVTLQADPRPQAGADGVGDDA